MNFKVFVAGPQTLNDEKDIFRIVANQMSVKYALKGNDLAILTYASDDFVSFISKEGGQAKYDAFIADEADMLLCYFKDEIGGQATIKELTVAINAYLRKGHPKICIFFHGETKEQTDASVEKINDLIGRYVDVAEHQYYQQYTDLASLRKGICDCIENTIKEVAPTVLRPNVVEGNGLIRNGEQYIGEKEWTSAYEAFSRALESDLNDWGFYRDIAVVCAKAKDDKDPRVKVRMTSLAIDAYRRALERVFIDDIHTRALLIACKGGLLKRLAHLKGVDGAGAEHIEEALHDLEYVFDYMQNPETPVYAMADPYALGLFTQKRIEMFYYDLIGTYSLLGNKNMYESICNGVRDGYFRWSGYAWHERYILKAKSDQKYPPRWH